MKTRLILLMAVTALASCSSRGPLTPALPPSGIDALLGQARQLEQSGDLTQAIALAERAVRIEPRNARAWHQLARLYRDQGDEARARQFARRSIQFAGEDKALIKANQRLIDSL